MTEKAELMNDRGPGNDPWGDEGGYHQSMYDCISLALCPLEEFPSLFNDAGDMEVSGRSVVEVVRGLVRNLDRVITEAFEVLDRDIGTIQVIQDHHQRITAARVRDQIGPGREKEEE